MKTIAFLVLSLVMLGCNSGPLTQDQIVAKVAKQSPGVLELPTKSLQVTPLGSRVYSPAPLPQQQLVEADEALSEVFLDAEAMFPNGFPEDTFDHTRYVIYTPVDPCIPSPETKTPSFYLNSGSDYDGSQFDQWNPKGPGVKDGVGVVQAAEKVISFDTDGSIPKIMGMMVCPNTETWKNGVRYGAEHGILAKGKTGEIQQYFSDTLYHYTISHPLINHRKQLKE